METASSLVKAMEILRLLAAAERGLSLPELLLACDYPRSTAVRILNTFALLGYVERRGRRHLLTDSFRALTQPGRHEALRRRYRPVLEKAAAEIGELVLLGLHEGNGIIHIDYIESDHAVRVAPAPFTRHPLPRTAIGKLALSRRPDLVARLRKPRLAEELAEVRRRGVAWNRGESVPGMIALAVPGFTNEPAEPMLCVAWPAARFTEAAGRRAVKLLRTLLS